MRTSLNELKNIESYLNSTDMVFKKEFEFRLLSDHGLRSKVEQQKKIYRLVKFFSRKRLKAELKTIEHQMFRSKEHANFQQNINQIFVK